MIKLKPLTKEHLTPFNTWFYYEARFKKEGIIRNACFRDGQFHANIMMSV
ncbi:MAG: hypothetical protein RLZZ231_837 [Bacteroidota bacterium]|jgi:hypothetical protein